MSVRAVQYRTTDHYLVCLRTAWGGSRRTIPHELPDDGLASHLLNRRYTQPTGNRMNFQEPVQSTVCDRRLFAERHRDPIPLNRSCKPDFEEIVDRHYRPLYQFAFSLTHSEADACDLTQQTFLIWSTKGSQLRDLSKVRSWLFTTLHRAFLQTKRHQTRFPHYTLHEVDTELPELPPLVDSRLDAFQALDALYQIDEPFRAPVALFYLEDCPYKEIASILDIPLGTVKSRIARGIVHLQKLLMPARPMPNV